MHKLNFTVNCFNKEQYIKLNALQHVNLSYIVIIVVWLRLRLRLKANITSDSLHFKDAGGGGGFAVSKKKGEGRSLIQTFKHFQRSLDEP